MHGVEHLGVGPGGIEAGDGGGVATRWIEPEILLGDEIVTQARVLGVDERFLRRSRDLVGGGHTKFLNGLRVETEHRPGGDVAAVAAQRSNSQVVSGERDLSIAALRVVNIHAIQGHVRLVGSGTRRVAFAG